MVDIVGDNNEWPQVLSLADMLVPGGLKVKTLIGRGELRGIFKPAPDRLCRVHVVEDFDAGDAARTRSQQGAGHLAFNHSSHGHRAIRFLRLCLRFSAWSTFTKKCQQRVMALRERWAAAWR